MYVLNKIMNRKKQKCNKGFTLIEMLVSVAIFSIVLIIALGAILTVLDSNRKAQTLTSVINNLNFTLEAMTRSIKTGVEPSTAGGILTVQGIDLSAGTFDREEIRYKRLEDADGKGSIGRCKGTDCTNFVSITAPEVDVETFIVIPNNGYDTNDSIQPRTMLYVEGSVFISDKIQSRFRIQTSISQRRLDVPGSEI